ncbi:DgyrCDS3710 [Dimorphilus gyrociliatus]|uniref:tRNA (guanine(10)-N(2))-methyltransferase n=1 Tax=Dimorphilus gyrociliatus TaxID=2664684 RepID=A0A7I8VG40_9ANNE|nr:DgyrCDS3710 [Dimorphilus gyrociliatus]
MLRKYILQFTQDYLEFRLPEFFSIASSFNIPVKIDDQLSSKQNPVLVVEVPSEECLRKIANRTVLLRNVIEYWGSGKTIDEVKSEIENLPKEITEPYVKNEKTSFSVKFHSSNHNIDLQEKVIKIDNFLESYPINGKVNLKNPEKVFHLIECYKDKRETSIPILDRMYFGRFICDSDRNSIKDFHLSKRKVIGNTSMDAELSFIISNISQSKSGGFIYDPFVGTGSLLVACAKHGAFVSGCDIDKKLLSGRGKSSRKGQKWRDRDETVRGNLKQYGLDNRYFDVLIADTSKQAMWNIKDTMFDAIVTDPPYGIREPTVKSGNNETKLSNDQTKMVYVMTDILSDLLLFAAKYLHIGGRLVFWLPVYREEYVLENIPENKAMQCIFNCEQILNSKVSRRLLTYQKTRAFQPDTDNNVHFGKNHYEESFRDRINTNIIGFLTFE